MCMRGCIPALGALRPSWRRSMRGCWELGKPSVAPPLSGGAQNPCRADACEQAGDGEVSYLCVLVPCVQFRAEASERGPTQRGGATLGRNKKGP